MKKTIITLSTISFALICQAQWVIGSGLDYKFTSEKNVYPYDKKSYSEFLFTPMVGYQKNKLTFGGNIILKIDSERTVYDDQKRWKPNRKGLLGIQPFVRYTFVEFGKFSVFTNIGTHFGYGTTEQFADNTLIEGYFYGINIVPVFSYSLSKKINLEATLNFVNLGWNTIRPPKTQFDPDSSKYRKTITNIGLGKNSGNITNVNVISFGIVYR
jgi:hypothetical protein